MRVIGLLVALVVLYLIVLGGTPEQRLEGCVPTEVIACTGCATPQPARPVPGGLARDFEVISSMWATLSSTTETAADSQPVRLLHPRAGQLLERATPQTDEGAVG